MAYVLTDTPAHTCTLGCRKDRNVKGHEEETISRDKKQSTDRASQRWREGDSLEQGARRGEGEEKELKMKGRAVKEIRGGGKGEEERREARKREKKQEGE